MGFLVHEDFQEQVIKYKKTDREVITDFITLLYKFIENEENLTLGKLLDLCYPIVKLDKGKDLYLLHYKKRYKFVFILDENLIILGCELN